MKLGPVTKLDKRNKTMSKKFDVVMSENCDVIVFSQNLEHSRGWVLDTESAKVMFSVTVTFCLTKTEKRTKKSLTQFCHYCFE